MAGGLESRVEDGGRGVGSGWGGRKTGWADGWVRILGTGALCLAVWLAVCRAVFGVCQSVCLSYFTLLLLCICIV
jgi:hypothetical protein